MILCNIVSLYHIHVTFSQSLHDFSTLQLSLTYLFLTDRWVLSAVGILQVDARQGSCMCEEKHEKLVCEEMDWVTAETEELLTEWMMRGSIEMPKISIIDHLKTQRVTNNDRQEMNDQTAESAGVDECADGWISGQAGGQIDKLNKSCRLDRHLPQHCNNLKALCASPQSSPWSPRENGWFPLGNSNRQIDFNSNKTMSNLDKYELNRLWQ